MKEFDHIDLRNFNSFGVSAAADRLIEVGSVDELRELFSKSAFVNRRWDVLGGGNNILFVDNYPGTLIKPVMDGIEHIGDQGRSVRVRAGAGVEWDDLVDWCVARGLWGLENLSLIPGKVGAAPVQNIGAYGVEAGDIIESVEIYRPETGELEYLSGGECEFGYRDSIFKHHLKGKAIITAVTLRLSTEAAPNLRYGQLEAGVMALGGPSLENIRRAVISIRESKLPDPRVMGNAGSFFKNPAVSLEKVQALQAEYPDMPVYPTADGRIKLAAGWLIDKAGWKGYRAGHVGVHPNQALVLINLGGANGADVMNLARMIADDVRHKFGVDIEPEVSILP